MLYLVTCPRSDAEPHDLHELIAELAPDAWHAFENTWVVESNETAVTLRNALGRHLDEDRPLIVALLAGHAAWRGFGEQSEDWLLAHL